MNTFGTRFRLTDFGESHGPAMGGVIDGVPAGWRIDLGEVQRFLDRRAPGNSRLVSARREPDKVQFLSGISPEGTTYGTPIGFIIPNRDARSSDYDRTRGLFRPNHADFTYLKKYGTPPLPGGGRSSARQTVCRVVAGAVASQLLAKMGISCRAYVSQIGSVALPEKYPEEIPDGLTPEMERLVERTKADGDSIGGCVSCRITGLPPGVGDPVYGKLNARLADAMMSVNGAKAFEIGSGAASAEMLGSNACDLFSKDGEGNIVTLTNNSGGIQGGISNGMPVLFSVAFKPTPTLMKPLPTVDLEGNPAVMKAAGRHDPCIAIRGAVVVEAMAALVLADVLAYDGLLAV